MKNLYDYQRRRYLTGALYGATGIGLAWAVWNASTPRQKLETEVSLGDPVQRRHTPQKWREAPPGWDVTMTEHYSIDALVLSTKRYRFDRLAEISPLDFALAWGVAAQPHIQDKLSISQSNRWYYWRAKELPAPVHVLNKHMANVHIIAENETIKTILMGVRAGDLVSMRGHIVDAKHLESNTVFYSSRTRTDTGAGACEIFLVKQCAFL